MSESIFDLQNDIMNLVVSHGLGDKDFMLIFKEGRVSCFDISNMEQTKNQIEKNEV